MRDSERSGGRSASTRGDSVPPSSTRPGAASLLACVPGGAVVALDVDDRERAEQRRLQRLGLALQAAGLGTWEWQVPDGHDAVRPAADDAA